MLTIQVIHIHRFEDGSAAAILDKLLSKIDSLTLKIDKFMANTQERFDLLMQRLDTATNDIAADYKQLLDEIKNGNVSDESLAKAEANIAKLETLGASVENPVPEPETGDNGAGGNQQPQL